MHGSSVRNLMIKLSGPQLTSATLAATAVLVTAAAATTAAEKHIPATPLMTVYQFDGPESVPYYAVRDFVRRGPVAPAGGLPQGSSVIPCLVIRNGRPLTDKDGTPYVGFEIIVDPRVADPESAARFMRIFEQRQRMTSTNHHCAKEVSHVIDARRLHVLGRPPRFDPPRPPQAAAEAGAARDEIDAIVRRFHNSTHCETVNRQLMNRPEGLRRAWEAFSADNPGKWSHASLQRARHLDFVLRTAIYEAHLERGCSAYGACERNVIALSIRNRAHERCLRSQGCRHIGDLEGVASKTSQYNIWDEYLAQTSGLTSCFLRPDLAAHAHYARLQAMYAQSAGDIERILFGSRSDLKKIFPGHRVSELLELRHYYHPPAMSKCFPGHSRLEYMSGAVARRGVNFVLIADTRIEVGERRDEGYLFRQAIVEEEADRDVVRIVDRFPGFVVDGRKVELRPGSRCAPYGVPSGCRFERIGRYRRTPAWLSSGKPMKLACRVRSRGDDCRQAPVAEMTTVGGPCDTWMQPVAGVP